MMRSLLFVPGDSDRKLEKAVGAGADALIVDLEDSVAADFKQAARALTADYLRGKDDVWVRINPIQTHDAMADLDAVLEGEPAGIVLPKCRGADDVKTLAKLIEQGERENGTEHGNIKIIALVTETPEALFSLGGYAGASARLVGLSWGAEDLSAALGASRNRDDDGNWLPPYQMARTLCLFAAGAAEVAAFDTVYTDFRDSKGLARFATEARRDGFSGMLAIHPGQVETINDAFRPTAAEIDRAERIVGLFDEHPGAGTLGMDGEMIDRPHLVQARRILELAKRQ